MLTVVTASPPLAELRRQSRVLADLGMPPVEDARLNELADRVPAEPFVLVPPGLTADAIGRVRLGVTVGFTTMEPADLACFVPLPVLDVPEAPYLLEDVDTGAATRGVRPDDALPQILAAGRTPLTLEEGLAVVLQHPQWLRDRNCFELLGSRAGDKAGHGAVAVQGRPGSAGAGPATRTRGWGWLPPYDGPVDQRPRCASVCVSPAAGRPSLRVGTSPACKPASG